MRNLSKFQRSGYCPGLEAPEEVAIRIDDVLRRYPSRRQGP